MAKDNKKFWKNRGHKGSNGGSFARNGSGPVGNADRKSGGYNSRGAGVAGALFKGDTASIGSGKFGSSADVAPKLTFGQDSVTFQAGFNNEIVSLNHPVNGANFNQKYSINYCGDTTAAWPYANASRSLGVMCLELDDYLGANNNTEKSPLNMAANLNKQFVDTALGEQLTFSACDLGVYFGGVKALWDLIYVIRRAINLAHNDKSRSNYRTAGIYRAMKITKSSHPTPWRDPSYEIAANGPKYMENMNGIIKRLNTVVLPDNLKWLVTYTESAYSNVFMDCENIEQAQLYVCMPRGYYLYDETDTSDPGDPASYYNGAHLDWRLFKDINGDGYVSIDDLINLAEDMVERLASKTNSDSMAQKVLNAHGSSNCLVCPTFANSNDLVPIVYDVDFLEALENAVLIDHRAIDGQAQHGYTIDAAREIIIGRPVYLEDNTTFYWGGALISTVNIPLQFHKEPSQIDAHAISNALRWHPVTSFFRDDGGYANHHEFDFANNFGLQVLTYIHVVYVRNNNEMAAFAINDRKELMEHTNALQDFGTIPIGVTADMADNNVDIVLNNVAYNARRDCEVTINGELVANYFWSLAEMVWDVVDGQTKFQGQRN